jgi:4-hydroxybenzoate polyprenyltransferase
MNRVLADTDKRPAGLANYLALARFDHATKHVFILPGIGLALTLRGIQTPSLAFSVAVGLIAAISIASANYVINEYLDREFDQHHPTKSARNAVQTVMDWRVIVALWVAFLTVGLAAAALGGLAMFLIAAAFAAQGIVYNVRPLRTKEVAYLDVLSEAVNNSFRLMIGWVIVDPNTLPPASIILASICCVFRSSWCCSRSTWRLRCDPLPRPRPPRTCSASGGCSPSRRRWRSRSP